ncbi:MAG: helix-turn-helix domain-containing protein [Acidobacteriota bacterium]
MKWQNAFSVVEPQINGEGVHEWPFDPCFPVDVSFFIFDRQGNIRMNRHDYFEILYVHSGEVVYQIQDRLFPMHENDMVVISSTQYHTAHLPSQKPSSFKTQVAVLYFLPELIRGLDTSGDEVEYLSPFHLQDSDFPHVIQAGTGVPAEIYELIARIHRELPPTSVRGRLAVKTYLKMILMLLVNHYTDYAGSRNVFLRKQRAIERLRPLFQFLENHYSEPIRVEDAAATVYMSQSHFMRLFKEITGQSFVTYLNHFRIEKAQYLLTYTDRSISEISQDVGFCDQSYFGLTFKNLFHMTPLQYKNQFSNSSA